MENENQPNSIGDRIKLARNDAGHTRKSLGEATKIPSSTLEKYERGDMDPNTARLTKICETLGVTVDWMMNGDSVDQNEDASPSYKSANAELPSHDPTPAGPEDLLIEIDDLWHVGFKGSYRRVTALIEDTRQALRYLDADALLSLARERGLRECETMKPGFLEGLFSTDLEAAKSECGSIEERIIDTAVLGLDLYFVDWEALSDLAFVEGIQ